MIRPIYDVRAEAQEALVDEGDDEELIDEYWEQKTTLEMFFLQGLTDHDKEKQAVTTSIRIPTKVLNVVKNIARKKGKSVNWILTMIIKTGAVHMSRIAKHVRLRQNKAILREAIEVIASNEYEEMIQTVLESKPEIRISRGKGTPRTIRIIWWINGALGKMGDDFGMNQSDLIQLTIYMGLSKSTQLKPKVEERMEIEVREFERHIKVNGLLLNLVVPRIGEFMRAAIEETERSEEETAEDMYAAKAFIRQQIERYPEEGILWGQNWLEDIG